jgi:hypothetical protein
MSARKIKVAQWSVVLALTIAVLSLGSCSKQEKPAETQGQATQKTFASPDDAAKALVDAAKTDNRDAMLAMFGPGSKDYLYSADAAEDKASFAGFVSDYDVMHRWRKMENGSEMLITGADNKTFPIPLSKNAAGHWYFDTEAGKQEILSRRIGKNELAAIDICAAIAETQHQYFSQHHDGTSQYAQKFISDEGKQNGLYWPSTEGQQKSPLGPVVAYATAEGYKVKANDHRPFWGYYFVMLDKQGPDAKGGAKNYVVNGKMTAGFAVLAYPAQYGDTGIMTFMINQNGVMYQKDLGKTTEQLASGTTDFNPDNTWKQVGD